MFIYRNVLVSFAAAAIVVSGCGSKLEQPAGQLVAGGKGESNSVAVNDSPADADPWFDITVLEAHVLDRTLKDFDRVEHCNKVVDRTDYDYHGHAMHYEDFDCSDTIGGQMGATAFRPMPKWQFINGQLITPLDTPIIEILTVIPVDRLSKATHVGFSESFMGGRVNLFVANGPQGQTREVEKVTLKDGRIGIVHRWVAAFECNGHNGEGLIRTVPFKPVLVRWDGDQQARYWDRYPGVGMRDYVITNMKNYVLVEPNAYDRREELLLLQAP